MKIEDPRGSSLPELADRFEERQALDVADGAADFDQDEIDVLVPAGDEILDGIGYVRDDLNGAAEIGAATFLGEDVLIDPPGRDVVRLARGHTGEAFVVPKIEIGLGSVVGDENLPVLIGAHRTGIDVQVGVELAQPD